MKYITPGFWLVIIIVCILFLLQGCGVVQAVKKFTGTDYIDGEERVHNVCPTGYVEVYEEETRKFGNKVRFKCQKVEEEQPL